MKSVCGIEAREYPGGLDSSMQYVKPDICRNIPLLRMTRQCMPRCRTFSVSIHDNGHHELWCMAKKKNPKKPSSVYVPWLGRSGRGVLGESGRMLIHGPESDRNLA